MKSYDTTPGETASEEITAIAPEAINSQNPTEITEVEAEVHVPQSGVELEMETPGPEVADNPALAPRATQNQATIVPIPGDELPPGRLFKLPTREQLLAWAPFWAVIILGVLLRFWDLGAKPLHHDESLHAYFALGLLHNPASYKYDPLLHGPFQFHAIALVYKISQWLGAPDNGVNTTTVRIAAAVLGSVLVGLPYFVRDYLGKLGAWLACLLLAVSPSMVYFSRFAREDIYLACFTLLMVVAVARYVRDRKMSWLLLAAAGFALAYATAEATFLTIAVFGSFLGALLVWELGSKFSLREWVVRGDQEAGRFLPRTFAPVAVLVYFLIAGIAAKIFFARLDQFSTYINNNQSISDAALANLEAATIKVVPWLGILLGLFVFSILAREIYGKLPQPGRRGLARFVDRRQPVLDTILTMPWTHWFFALILAWAIFLTLFTVLFTNLPNGIGDGIWKGLYYWLEQQKVARGGQPWYYYLLLIPLYEQIGLVFGVVGIIRSLFKPNAFRLFLVYWFLGDFFLYSWAGEKMPWLMIFMTMPMMLLAAIGLEPCVMACYRFARERFFSGLAQSAPATSERQPAQEQALEARPRIGAGRAALGLFGVVMAVLLLLPTLQNMYQVSYVHPADGPYEMMVYVQTTNDVSTLMARIDAVNQKDFGGSHQMRIGVTGDATWPFAWYLRDYPNVCFNYPDGCPSWKNNVPVVIAGGDNPYGDITTYAPAGGQYLYHEYHMRSWWDEGYKLPACLPGHAPSTSCSNPDLGSGVGPLLWLSYGDSPPPGAKFNLGLTIQRVWNWWWHRQPFGSVNGAYDMELFIQKNMGVTP